MRGWSSEASSTANRTSGSSGAFTSRTHARLTTNTITPEIADSPASTRIDASTVGVSVTPAERRSATRARGGRPDPARQVLREHRDHLGLQRDAVADVDSPRVEHPDPAEDEDQVVGGRDITKASAT